MTELMDYSGEFESDLSMAKFSKQTLLKLIKAYSDYLIKVDAFWFLTVKDRWGKEAANECDIEILKNMSKPYEVKLFNSLLGIRGNDISAFVKLIQVSPWGQSWERQVELKNGNYATLVTPVCPTLLAIEKEGSGRELEICEICGKVNLGTQARCINPLIEVNPLKLPPRKTGDDIACKWEFSLKNSV